MRSSTFNMALGILALAATYHLGARSATAQAHGNPVVTFSGGLGPGISDVYGVAVTASGDVYYVSNDSQWHYRNNIFGGGPVPATRESFGALKSRYRGAPGAAQPATEGR